MDENKQIEEMGLAICKSRGASNGEGCEWCGQDSLCLYQQIAMSLYGAGYRKQEWISVEERLPTEQRDALAYYGFDRGDGDLGMMFTGILTYFPFDKKPHFQHEETGLRVTHWMPLPDAPKGE